MISVFRAWQEHRAVLEPSSSCTGERGHSTALSTCPGPSRARAHVLHPWAQL